MNMCRKKQKKGLRKGRKWAVTELQEEPQLTLKETVEFGVALHIVPS